MKPVNDEIVVIIITILLRKVHEENEDIEGGLRKFLDTRRGGNEKIVGLGGGLPKFVYLKTNT